MVETENKKAAEVRRAEMEKEKAAREQMKEDRAKAMAATMEANKGQTQKTKAVVEAKIKDKLDKGAAIRDQSHSRMQQKKAQHDAFLAKAAQQAKELGSDLKESVATKKKEQTEKNRQARDVEMFDPSAERASRVGSIRCALRTELFTHSPSAPP